ncbi:MAG: tetraacyldisaccharide 4'-kinase [Flavobacteriales bacterium]|nr:tetraacyldisaccharide 4'-kinase [Flavobacteriales bacterium]
MLPLIIVLRPFSWIYGSVLRLRHRLYDKGMKKSSYGPLKTIVIGNLELGGTGKTPLTIHVLQLLQKDYRMGFLSRGYGRDTKGFQRIQADSDPALIGDEPLLINQSCPGVESAVCEDRLQGLEELAEKASLDFVVLDDAYQHRKLASGFNILVTPYAKPFWKNHLIPEGSLRDLKERAKAAHCIVISKCPEHISEEDFKDFREQASWYSSAPVYFARLKYGNLINLKDNSILVDWPDAIVAVSGIADATLFHKKISSKSQLIRSLNFADHYLYKLKDIRRLKEICSSFAGRNSALVTTSKDGVKLKRPEFLRELEGIDVFELPIEIEFLSQGFDEMIIAYARANKRDS